MQMSMKIPVMRKKQHEKNKLPESKLHPVSNRPNVNNQFPVTMWLLQVIPISFAATITILIAPGLIIFFFFFFFLVFLNILSFKPTKEKKHTEIQKHISNQKHTHAQTRYCTGNCVWLSGCG